MQDVLARLCGQEGGEEEVTKAITIGLLALVVSFFTAGAYQTYAQTASPTPNYSTPTPTSSIQQGVGGSGTTDMTPTPTSSIQQGVGGSGTTPSAPATGFGN